MRLTLSALLCTALVASPALARDGRHDRHRDDAAPSYGADLPPPPPGYAPYGYGAPIDPRWEQDQARMHHEWAERCGDDRGRDHDDGLGREGCGGYPAPYGYPGAYAGYAVPMIMVPVLRSKPCPETVEEVVEEVAPVRRRMIPPRPHAAAPVKRVPDKRLPMTPTKRIAY